MTVIWKLLVGIAVASVLSAGAAAEMTFSRLNVSLEGDMGAAGVGTDLVTGAAFAYYSEGMKKTVTTVALPEATTTEYMGIFDKQLYLLNKTIIIAGTFGAEVCAPGQKSVYTEYEGTEEPVLGASVLGVDGLANSTLVVFLSGEVQLVEAHVGSAAVVKSKHKASALTNIDANTTVRRVPGGAAVRNVKGAQFFVNTTCLAAGTSEDGACVQTLRGLQETALCAAADRAGYWYTAGGHQVTQYRVDGAGAATAQRSVYVDREREVSGLFFDDTYDMLYVLTGGKSSNTEARRFFRVPAGDAFAQAALEMVETTLTGTDAVLAATVDRAYVLTHGGAETKDELGFVQLQQCSGPSERACLEDVRHCRYALAHTECMAQPACAAADVCVADVPRIVAFEPRAGAVQGAVPITVTFAAPLPATTVQARVGTSALVDATVSADRTQLVFYTSAGMAPEERAAVEVRVAQYRAAAAERYRAYDCAGATCGACAGAQDECVWLVDRGVCTSARAQEAQGRGALAVANRHFCPAFTSQSVRVSAAREDVVLGVNTLFSAQAYVCTFRNATAAVRTTGRIDWEDMHVRCPSPRASAAPDGTYTLSVGFGAGASEITVFETLDGERVTVEYTQCRSRTDCSACTGVGGCAWAFNSSAFMCVSSTECPGCVRYENRCPAVRNKLYADADAVETPHEVVLELEDAQLDSTMNLTCIQEDATGASTAAVSSPAICDPPTQTCRCNLTWTRGRTGAARVALAAGGTPFVESTFHAVRCGAHASFGACMADASRACVWCVAEARCGINPGRSNGTCVSAVPAVAAFTPVIDALGHAVEVVFTSMVFGMPAHQFACELVGADQAVLAASTLRVHNETHGTCAFGSLAAQHGIGPNQALYNVSLVIRKVNKSSVSLRDGQEDDIFAQLETASSEKATVVNCDSENVDLTCRRCQANALCAWSGRRAMCTAVLDETSSHSECPTVTALTPTSGYFERRRTKNLTLTGTRLVAGLAVRFVPLDAGSAGDAVEGNLTLVNATALNYTLTRGMAPRRYAVHVVVAAAPQRVFADTAGIVFERQQTPMSVALLLAIVVPLAAVAVALVAVLVVVLRRRGRRPFKFDVARKPDFARFAFATDLGSAGARGFPADARARDELRALLEDRLVCGALCRATASTEADRFASAMVYVHATDGQCLDLLMALVEQEVQSVPNSTQLFRGNSLASKAFRAYSRMVGLEYLWLTLARFVHELDHLARQKDRNKGKSRGDASAAGSNGEEAEAGAGAVSVLSTEFEVDPTKLGAGADEEAQTYMLSQRARQLVLCITQSTPHLPAELRALAAMLAAKVAERFPDAEHIAVGGTFFLRFICPAVIAPHCYGLLLTPDRRTPVVPGDRLQRQLVLLGKVLQNLANGVLFGKKEPFMLPMNEFISNNLPLVNDWMDTISASTAGVRFAEQATPVPPKTLTDSYSFLAAHIRAAMPKIRAALQAQNAPPELAQRLENVVNLSS